MTRVLIVDDEANIVRAWSRCLDSEGYDIHCAGTLAEAREQLKGEPFRVILLDLHLPDGDGKSLLPDIEKLRPAPAVAVVSGHLDSTRVLEVFDSCCATFPKPVPAVTLRSMVASLAQKADPTARIDAYARKNNLSRRETEVLHAAARGLSLQQAADLLGCRPATIGSYWRRIFSKTGWRSQRDVLAAVLRG